MEVKSFPAVKQCHLKKKKLKNIVYRIQKIFLNKNRPICMLYK